MDSKSLKSGFHLIGEVELKYIERATGKILAVFRGRNTVVDTGLDRFTRLAGGDSSTNFTHLAIGTGTTAVQSTDTELETEVAREAATITYPANGQVKFNKLFTFGSGESYSISEVGVFDNAIASGSTMLNRMIQSPAKDVDADIDLDVSITITAQRP